MSITIPFKVRELVNPLDLHFIPVKVNGDGKADVNNYFNSYTRKESCGILSNAIRGLPLKGEVLTVPTTHKAIVLQETGEILNSGERRKLYVTGNFDSFHYWNYDKIPTIADTYKQALQLHTLSDELSSSVLDGDICAEMEKNISKSKSKENGA